MIWDQLTSENIKGLDHSIPAILPVAATEQHGAHLPVATDRLIAEHFAFQTHTAVPEQVLILPCVGIGCSNHHMDFSGTLTLTHHTFLKQVEEIIQSVFHHGFTKIIILNSHGGNQGAGQVLVEKLGHQYPDCDVIMTSWWQIARNELMDITETGFGGVGHAGEFETSLMMLIAPELVHHQKITSGKNQSVYNWAKADLLHGPAASWYRSMKQLTPNGIFGEPGAASVEKGKHITETVVRNILNIIQDLQPR
ncbi:MAG: creatininase [Cyclobacteriaceae bacterium]|nr:MAG: creatininase [Cyclobacteriaceae bacterium]